ncbi:MAG: PilN domain-containing protein [Atribacterota bacterium]|nr:PilN domain-containing protein [Atribacterota bacterium]MDD5636215.1 PilN domain-containing protein [Atribacterota bacterium]
MAKNKNIIRDINLLPSEYREKEKFNLFRILIATFIILLFAASGFLYFYLENEILTRENEVRNLETQLKAIEKVIQEVKNLEKDKAELAERVAVIESLITNQSRMTRVLGDFSESTFSEVWLNNLSINANQSFNLVANTFNNYLVAQYMNSLKDHQGFDAIELQYIRKQTTRIPEMEKNIDTVSFQLSGIFIPYYRLLNKESSVSAK